MDSIYAMDGWMGDEEQIEQDRRRRDSSENERYERVRQAEIDAVDDSIFGLMRDIRSLSNEIKGDK